MSSGFSFQSRQEALKRFETEQFDLLIIGGGITGAATARDAASRGLKVALVEKRDFAWGTSSRSSKLIHGGLRYLEGMEFGLVFEALSERALLLKTAPHLVRPLPFFLPVYKEDAHGKGVLSLGLWIYDLLSFLRTPGFHKRLTRDEVLKQIPSISEKGLTGGFRYYDASMWDDVLAIETIRAAHEKGVAVANYAKASAPVWSQKQITGFLINNLNPYDSIRSSTTEIRAHRTVICAGPWTDQIGATLSPRWRSWLNPSKGVHLIFDSKRLPVPGAVVMSHPEDGRISFVIPRPDFGSGVTIVGTTDGPSNPDPEETEITRDDVSYIMDLLNKYFPSCELKNNDIISAYVGVRPLMGATASTAGSEGQNKSRAKIKSLQKISREHFIGDGPGSTVIVAGGKYTTHRKMAEEIVDYTLESWKQGFKEKTILTDLPKPLTRSLTKFPINPQALPDSVEKCKLEAKKRGWKIPDELLSRYGADSLSILQLSIDNDKKNLGRDPEGFPRLSAQLRHAMRTSMVMHLEDFYLRRIPLYSSRADHGLPWAKELSEVWADELGLGEVEARIELKRLEEEIERRDAWRFR